MNFSICDIMVDFSITISGVSCTCMNINIVVI